MTFSTLSVARTSTSPPSLWGNALRLVVVVAPVTYEGKNYLLAYGIDPEHVDPQRDTPVFERMLPIDGLGDFLSVLIDGGPDEQKTDEVAADTVLKSLATQGGGSIIANSVDVTNSQPPPPGPKVSVVLALASSITSDESLAAVGA